MKQFHFYHAETGILHGDAVVTNKIEGAEKFAEANCPDGHKIIEGNFDPLSQKVDVENGGVVDHKPPQPSEDHEWHEDKKRWLLKSEAAAKAVRVAALPARLAELREKQHDLVIGYLLGRVTADKLREIDEQIKKLLEDS